MNTLLASTMVLADSFSLDKDTVTPGVMGFLAIFAIGVALFFLMRNMTGKLEGVSERAEEAGEKPSGPNIYASESDEAAETDTTKVEASGSDKADSGTDKG
ncbi:hypothetical protein ACWGSK_10680 [Nocardiopsis sp. NPDC055551]|uniref:hypothetical protein n=1 Tax=Nocardiopsis sp. NPDC006832 TaxID=3157188 RepID=UPI0033C98F08